MNLQRIHEGNKPPPPAVEQSDPDSVFKKDDVQEIVRYGMAEGAARRFPHFFLEVFKRQPLSKLSDSEVKGTLIRWLSSEGKLDIQAHNPLTPRRLDRSYHEIDIPSAVADAMNEYDHKRGVVGFANNSYMLGDFLTDMCELKPEEVIIGRIPVIKEGADVDTKGFSIRIDKSAYARMAKEALLLMADPAEGYVMTGFTSPELYIDAFKNDRAEVTTILRNLYKYGNLTEADCRDVLVKAQVNNNSGFAEQLGAAMRGKGGDLPPR